MNGAGAVVMGGLLLIFIVIAQTAKWSGKRKDAKDAEAIAKDPHRYIAESFGDGFFRDFYRGAISVDNAIDRATRSKEPGPFVSHCECPDCNYFGLHHIYKFTGKYVIRQCVDSTCKKKWKQLRW
ncbi:hypothetical protein MADRUGA_93 [Mycobacterium phage Madruga]|uniref:Uncharacterized protein n=1 Tax=Mycobacterium phage Madruga TaxID=1675552 RepID=A0A0K1LS55_9CAUD|nr:hypothetical protein MADRUGA_93 [Mycobacterium phage Madruga]UOW93418.1 hypothetical protein SEA_LABELLE_94 [Mycobacterium phage Labelle]